MDLPILLFARPSEWSDWLEKHHAESTGVWLRLAKKAAPLESISNLEALQEALRYGWIDGQARGYDEQSWLHKFTPRRKRSIWSQVNRDKALELIKSGAMKPAGLAEVERAQADGRWAAAYAPPSQAEVAPDLQAALDANPEAAEFFKTLSGQNRYAILFRLQTARKAETRAKRLAQFVEMLARHEVFHPKPK